VLRRSPEGPPRRGREPHTLQPDRSSARNKPCRGSWRAVCMERCTHGSAGRGWCSWTTRIRPRTRLFSSGYLDSFVTGATTYTTSALEAFFLVIDAFSQRRPESTERFQWRQRVKSKRSLFCFIAGVLFSHHGDALLHADIEEGNVPRAAPDSSLTVLTAFRAQSRDNVSFALTGQSPISQRRRRLYEVSYEVCSQW